MNLGPVPRPTTLADRVITRLRAEITSGAWPVGSRIPTEPELVELGYSIAITLGQQHWLATHGVSEQP